MASSDALFFARFSLPRNAGLIFLLFVFLVFPYFWDVVVVVCTLSQVVLVLVPINLLIVLVMILKKEGFSQRLELHVLSYLILFFFYYSLGVLRIYCQEMRCSMVSESLEHTTKQQTKTASGYHPTPFYWRYTTVIVYKR